MVSLTVFEKYLEKRNHILKHWGMPSKTFELVYISSGKYKFIVRHDGEELFKNDKVSFEIHYDENEQLIGLFINCSDKGWFLQTEDLWEETSILLTVVSMYKNREELMKEIFEREIDVF